LRNIFDNDSKFMTVISSLASESTICISLKTVVINTADES